GDLIENLVQCRLGQAIQVADAVPSGLFLCAVVCELGQRLGLAEAHAYRQTHPLPDPILDPMPSYSELDLPVMSKIKEAFVDAVLLDIRGRNTLRQILHKAATHVAVQRVIA